MRLLDSAPIPGGGELGLYQHGQEFAIRIVDGQDLMCTRTHGSEDALAEITCRRIADRAQARILIGGLGFGFTLASALKHLGTDAQIVVAELVPAVIEWNRGPLGERTGHPLRDGRVTVHASDVSDIVRAESRSFDAILLDVDNGPDGLTKEGNHWLYSRQGLEACHQTLRPKGLLSVWSAGPDRAFSKRLRMTGFDVEEVKVRAHGSKGARHIIWVGTKPEV